MIVNKHILQSINKCDELKHSIHHFYIHLPMDLNNNRRTANSTQISRSKSLLYFRYIQRYGLMDFSVYTVIFLLLLKSHWFLHRTNARKHTHIIIKYKLQCYVCVYGVYTGNDYYRARLRTC